MKVFFHQNYYVLNYVLANFMQDNTSDSLETSSNLIASNRVWLSLVSSALHLQQQHPVLK